MQVRHLSRPAASDDGLELILRFVDSVLLEQYLANLHPEVVTGGIELDAFAEGRYGFVVLFLSKQRRAEQHVPTNLDFLIADDSLPGFERLLLVARLPPRLAFADNVVEVFVVDFPQPHVEGRKLGKELLPFGFVF